MGRPSPRPQPVVGTPAGVVEESGATVVWEVVVRGVAVVWLVLMPVVAEIGIVLVGLAREGLDVGRCRCEVDQSVRIVVLQPRQAVTAAVV